GACAVSTCSFARRFTAITLRNTWTRRRSTRSTRPRFRVTSRNGSALDRLLAELCELAHDGRTADRHLGLALPVFHRQLEIVFDEEPVELLGADGAESGHAVGGRIVIGQNPPHRLGGGPRP